MCFRTYLLFFYLFGQFNPLTANVLRYILLIFAHRKRDLRHCYQKLWTAPSYLPLTISLLTASRMVYWTRCLLNNGHQLSTLLRVCCQKEKMQIMSVCYREKNAISERLLSRAKLQIVSVCCRDKMQIRSNQSLLDMNTRNDRFK